MGIEQNLESIANAFGRIATALESIAEVEARTLSARERLVRCEEHRAVKAGMSPEALNVPEPKREADTAPAAEPVSEFTYDELKANLIKRGVEIPKGTKMTTLLKLWQSHKADPIAVNDPETAETDPVDEVSAEDPFGIEEPVIGDDLTLEEARAIIENHYDRSEADKAALIAAFAEAGQGICNFGAIPQGKFGAVVRKFLELKGAAL
jgi:hypothetical protein